MPLVRFQVPRPLCLLASLLCPCPATAQDLPATRPTSASPVAVTVLDLAGRTLAGDLARMVLPGGLRIDATGRSVEIPGGQVIWIGFDARPRGDVPLVQWFSDPPQPSRKPASPAVPIRVHLRDGQDLAGTLAPSRAPGSLALEHRLLGSLDLPFSRVRRVQVRPDPVTAPVRRALAAPAAFDVLCLANGDRVEGILQSLGIDKADIELSSGRQAEIPTTSIRQVLLADVPAAPASAPASRPAPSWHLRLRDGQRIAASKVAWDPARPAVTFTCGDTPAAVPAVDLVGIEPVTGKWVWLPDLPPAGYEHLPRVAPMLTWQPDATARGTPIYCGARPVLHALGVPAGSTIRYNLSGMYAKLLAWPILDDSSAPDASCRARILVDGRLAWQGEVSPSTAPAAVTINLVGKAELTLQVDPAGPSDALARFAWSWPVLIR